MADKPISLSKVRKDRARIAKRAQADANSAKYGRSRAERDRDQRQETLRAAQLDAHRRDVDAVDDDN